MKERAGLLKTSSWLFLCGKLSSLFLCRMVSMALWLRPSGESSWWEPNWSSKISDATKWTNGSLRTSHYSHKPNDFWWHPHNFRVVIKIMLQVPGALLAQSNMCGCSYWDKCWDKNYVINMLCHIFDYTFKEKHNSYYTNLNEYYVNVEHKLTSLSLFTYLFTLKHGHMVQIQPTSPVLSDLFHLEPPQVKMTALMNSRPHSFTP